MFKPRGRTDQSKSQLPWPPCPQVSQFLGQCLLAVHATRIMTFKENYQKPASKTALPPFQIKERETLPQQPWWILNWLSAFRLGHQQVVHTNFTHSGHKYTLHMPDNKWSQRTISPKWPNQFLPKSGLYCQSSHLQWVGPEKASPPTRKERGILDRCHHQRSTQPPCIEGPALVSQSMDCPFMPPLHIVGKHPCTAGLCPQRPEAWNCMSTNCCTVNWH